MMRMRFITRMSRRTYLNYQLCHRVKGKVPENRSQVIDHCSLHSGLKDRCSDFVSGILCQKVGSPVECKFQLTAHP